MLKENPSKEMDNRLIFMTTLSLNHVSLGVDGYWVAPQGTAGVRHKEKNQLALLKSFIFKLYYIITSGYAPRGL